MSDKPEDLPSSPFAKGCAGLGVATTARAKNESAPLKEAPAVQFDLAGVAQVPATRIGVLFVTNDHSAAVVLQRAMADHGIDLEFANDLSGARQLLSDKGGRLDVVLLDLSLPDGRGEELLPEIEALPRQLGIVILGDSSDGMRPEAFSYRAVLAPKTRTPAALAAILRLSAGGYVQHTLGRFAKRFKLTRKEADILSRVARGVSPKRVAVDLHCSVQAIYSHLSSVCAKTKHTSYPEVVAMLFQFSCHGLGHDTSPFKV